MPLEPNPQRNAGNKGKNFSFRARGQSFRYAWEGIIAFFNTQHNAFIYLFLTFTVIAGAIFLGVTNTEILFLIMASGLVWFAELFNTAIEGIMDYLSPEFHPKVKLIKDVAAAAVLVAAITAAAIGLIIFLPKLF